MDVVGRVDPRRHQALTAFVSGQRTTEGVVRALAQEGLELADVVEMDEFTIDLVVPLLDGLCLVYDTT